MAPALSIQKKIYLSLFAICSVMLITSIFDTYKNEQALAEELIEQQLLNTADGYFDAMNTMMVSGAMANRQIYQNKLLQQQGIEEARIIRADKVKQLYGPGFTDQGAKDDFDRQALQGRQIIQQIENDSGQFITLVKPIVASADFRGSNCLSCHQAKEGEVLGAVRLTYSMEHINESIKKNLITWAVFQGIIVFIGFIALGATFKTLVSKRLKRLTRTMNKLAEDTDLRTELDVMTNDEIGQVTSALNKVIVKFRSSLQSVSASSSALMNSSNQVSDISELARHHVHQQKLGTDSVATAVNELEASSEEVKQATQLASNKSEETNQLATEGSHVADAVKNSIDSLKTDIQSSADIINRLNEKTLEVGTVLEVIQSIAEQTNLLALNAAIEAARAGEQGRGFAVVADEVRTLATRTHDSTSEIKSTIEQLQLEAKQAVDAMQTSYQTAEKRADEVHEVARSLESIAEHIGEINDLNLQIANAAEQQNEAAEEINRNVVSISNIADSSAHDADKGKEISQSLVSLAQDLQQDVNIFKV